ncbi:choline kinase family protein [Parendozoicomonas haliclonae]|uniref:Thiamine kinase n=1 Tax=Parendozoicomonas haliclonae TaxID=1960125 RepID=A0A1X7ARF7_9GAMM|nr:choline kinase family protein [Parendozoicomonas haliclonae]SMA50679.1 thiamine kinase [Parendozoicomonas haliclonae]
MDVWPQKLFSTLESAFEYCPLTPKEADEFVRLVPEASVVNEVARGMGIRERDIDWLYPLSGGMTNNNYLFRVVGSAQSAGMYVVRIPGAGTSELIDRGREQQCLQAIAEADLDTRTCYLNPGRGIKVTQFITGKTYQPDDVYGQRSLIIGLLKKLHQLPCRQVPHYSFDDELSHYTQLAVDANAELPENWRQCVEQLQQWQSRLQPQVTCLCHNDLVPANFIEGQDRLYLIDWEYAGKNDPLFDIASCVNEAELPNEQGLQLLQDYLGHPPTLAEIERFHFWMTAQHLLWSIWAFYKVQAGDSTLKGYAVDRYRKAEAGLKACN